MEFIDNSEAVKCLLKISAIEAKQLLEGKTLSQSLFNVDINLQGIGKAKITQIEALKYLVKSAMNEEAQLIDKVSSSADAYTILRPYFTGLLEEHFYCLFLNRNNRVMSVRKISEGGMSGTVADPKLIFNEALKAKASHIILAHNHPSGQILPSQADKYLTKKMVEGGKFLDLPVLDHVILTDIKYFSFADEGLI